MGGDALLAIPVFTHMSVYFCVISPALCIFASPTGPNEGITVPIHRGTVHLAFHAWFCFFAGRNALYFSLPVVSLAWLLLHPFVAYRTAAQRPR